MNLRSYLPARLRVALEHARESLQALRHGLAGPTRQALTVPHSPDELARMAQEARSARPPAELRAQIRDLRVLETVRQTGDAVTLWLDNRGPDPLRFHPGQFLTLVLPIDGREHRRAYSLCSDPADEERVAVTVKRVADGRVSNWINDKVKAGQVIRTLGPSGTFGFQLRPNARRRLVLVGAGAGVTPLYAIAQGVTSGEPGSRVELVLCNRRWEDVIFREELARLVTERPRLRVRHVLTRPPGNWGGLRGRLVGENLARIVPPDRRAHYYICGPQGMMEAVTAHLEAGGVPGTRVHVERFVPQGVDSAPRVGKGERHRVRFARSGATLIVPDTRTILDAGLAAGLALPSSCRMGGCGACRQRVLSGEVVLEQPNCLTEQEREQGYRLLCVGRPAGPLELDC